MSELITIARPYAKAAFDFAVEKEALDTWSYMLSFAAEVARNETVKDSLGGIHSAEKLAEIFLFVCGEQLNEQGQNLVRVMAENGRLKVLPDVFDLFMAMRHEHDKQVDVDLISAIALTDEQKREISSKLETRLERKVKLTCSVDVALLGGLIIRTGDLVIDDSVRGSILRLNDALQS